MADTVYAEVMEVKMDEVQKGHNVISRGSLASDLTIFWLPAGL